jgi:putative endonuclease
MIKKYSFKQLRGLKAEKLACEYLKKQGLTLVTSNYTTPLGEIDLIMKNDTSLVFIEVRFRKNNTMANSIESINATKQRKIINTASSYLQKYPTWKECRFDVITIDCFKTDVRINWIRDAFEMQ